MAELKINARFKDAGVPKTGLSPTVTIFNRSTNKTVVTNGAMTELTDGFYEFILDPFDINLDFLFSFDGTATLSDADRFLESEWSGIADFINTIPRAIGGQFDVSKLIKTTRGEFKELKEALEDLIGSIEIDVDMEDIKQAISDSSKVNEEVAELHEQAIIGIRKAADESIKKSEKRLAERIKEMKLEVSTEGSDIKLEKISKSLDSQSKTIEKTVKGLLNEFGNFITSPDFLEKQLKNSGAMKEQTKMIEGLLNSFGEFIKSQLKK